MDAAKQQNLFDTEPLPWEADDAAEGMVATVAFIEGPAEPFDYLVPVHLHARAAVGRRVTAPLGHGNRAVLGYCVRLATRPLGPRPLKDLRSVIDSETLVSPPLFRVAEWMAERYLCSLGQAFEAVLPAAVRWNAGTRDVVLLSAAPAAAEHLRAADLPEKQLAVLRTLVASPRPLTIKQLTKAAGCTVAPIGALRKRQLVLATVERVRRDLAEPAAPTEGDRPLNPDQVHALAVVRAAIESGRHETVLLHGVTGSGKTEVYIRAIQEVVSYGRQAIVLVPEISLTPQTKERFRARFPNVAVLHSHLSDSERAWHWQRIAREHVPVVVGARSAVFAPVPHLGLIVVDEEHETSFKQDIAPRYHARDVAVERARAEQVPLVLGSATPALESWQRAMDGEYRLVRMPKRVLDRPLPDVRTIDLRTDLQGAMSGGAISRPLRLAMEQALAEEGQVILLLNRRGYSTHIQCPACGFVLRCPDCDIALTHHKQGELALCHYCEYSAPAPPTCPQCRFAGIRYGGMGTQRLEAEVRARFRDVPCVRMDTDTMRKPGSHERALAAFRAGDTRILLGTQMIAKGLDFPNVTLVGVINADTALHLPDFRAAERTFQLLVQVAGRTGRGDRGGRVLVQTFSPDHPAILAAVRHDYTMFADQELPLRRLLAYPPFSALVRLVVRGPAHAVAQGFAEHLADSLRARLGAAGAEVRILGPAPAPLAKLRGLYRFQVHLHGPDGAALRDALRETEIKAKPPDEVQWIVDVDPMAML